MKNQFPAENKNLNNKSEKQIQQSLNLLRDIFGKNLLGVYLYGSSILGGLQKYSDIDLFVVIDRATTHEEKVRLGGNLLQISGIYMQSSMLPIEITIVEKAKINPWCYPPHFDFQYGEWLREKFEVGIVEPWSTKEMPDLAILITQILLASKTLFGSTPDQLLDNVPYKDFIKATAYAVKNLKSDLNSDTRNVLLTFVRIWSTLKTDILYSKIAAADWAIDHLPEKYQPVIKRARTICAGEQTDYWNDMRLLIKPCSDFIVNQINHEIASINKLNNISKSIKLVE